MWMRNQGGHIRSSMGDGQNSTSANRYVLQLGSNIKTWDVGNSRTVLGVMGGYGHQKSNSSNSLTGNASTGRIDGYSAGLYSTWYQDASEQNGLYVDSWLQYGSFSNSVKGDGLVQESYRSHGLSGSLESGYNVTAAQWDSSSARHKLILQPHAQTAWSGVKLAKHIESNGTRVQGTSSSDVRMRLGVTAELNVTSLEDRNVSVTPYFTIDWLHGSNSIGVNMNGVGDTIIGTRNMAEVKTGVKGDISKNLSLAASAAQKFGQKDLRDISGTLDLRYTF